ncbi:dTDP-4-dehydrorhamnose reductase [Fulvivirga kasyanovii]|uniref:dTDP-4-dehydrorhamnose reductase n=1 Tax=Fulvivirga kasyanovii TaxID=396812 RepID=A0ABW9RNC2_9BACT|nr:SDR family oxidoreductase [Fulvivirga kasyanovii]MTI24435.1 SDR family oxidoreductase [Fulvivirga kasyanovii]
MKILITGSNGLLGQKLVKLMSSEADIEVIATARNSDRLPENYADYEFHPLDITDEAAVLDVVTQYKPDAIINTAAMTNVDQCESEKEGCIDLNVNAVKYLIKACEATGAHLVHCSTDFIFDGTHGPLDENEKPNPVNFYGESKLEAENLVMNSNISWAIARTVLVYGIANDMSRSNIILWVKNSLENGKEINVVDDQWRTPTLAEDLAMGCYLLAKKKAKGIYNISGKDMLTPYDMAIKTADFFKLDKTLIHKTDGSKFTQPAKRPPKTGFIIDKARKDLGYEPHSFEEGLKVLNDQMQLA